MKKLDFEDVKMIIKKKLDIKLVREERFTRKGKIAVYVVENEYGWFVSLERDIRNVHLELNQHKITNGFELQNLVNKFNRLRKVR